MYSTCLFCNKPLGRNESIEAFPVGERLAFDPAKGRLWVVCRQCERWNLSPLEERWEAIEQAERLYRDTRARVATDNIGLAKMRDGTTLVRIGEPMRPEFAAWRYGDQFGRRRNRQLLIAGAGVAGLGAAIAGGAAVGVGIGSFGWMIGQGFQTIIYGRAETVVARVLTDDHRLLEVRRRHLAESMIVPGMEGGFALELRYRNGGERFEGAEAARIASIVIPTVNRFGGKKDDVVHAVDAIESAGSPEAYLHHFAGIGAQNEKWVAKRRGSAPISRLLKYGLFATPTPSRLAFEMALHEESERRAMEGELALLEEAWRDAEEIAAIADDLALPAGIDDRLKKLKGD